MGLCTILLIMALIVVSFLSITYLVGLYETKQCMIATITDSCNYGHKNEVISMSWKEFKKLYKLFPENFFYGENPNNCYSGNCLFYVKDSSLEDKELMEAHNEPRKFVALNKDIDHIYIPIYFEAFIDFIGYKRWVKHYERYQEKIQNNLIQQEHNKYKLLMLDDLYKKTVAQLEENDKQIQIKLENINQERAEQIKKLENIELSVRSI